MTLGIEHHRHPRAIIRAQLFDPRVTRSVRGRPNVAFSVVLN